MNRTSTHTTVTATGSPSELQATVQHRPQAQPLSNFSLTGTDVMWIISVIAGLLALYSGIRKLVKDKKEEERQEANERAKIVTDAIERSRHDHERDTKEIKEKFSESKEIIDREISSIKQQLTHVDNNAKQRDDALRMNADKIESDRRADFTRVVQLEAKFEALVQTMADVKGMIKESREEHRVQFDQLCTSIREMSKRTPT